MTLYKFSEGVFCIKDYPVPKTDLNYKLSLGPNYIMNTGGK
jgi:hypothetical protein